MNQLSKKTKNFLLKLLLAGNFLLISILILLSGANIALAGFGISPPKVIAHHLLAGSYFEQTVYLVQGFPEKELKVVVIIEDSEIKDWISVDKGNEFIIPAGVQQFPIKTQINVPNKAELGDYKGIIRIKTMLSDVQKGQVSIALGGRIDLDLKVTEEEIFGFIIKSVNISSIEEGWPVQIAFNVKNTGNIETCPTKAILEIYDRYDNDILASGEFSGFNPIIPYQEKVITAEFPADLAVGEYWGHYTLYKDDKILREGKDVFNVVEKGTIDKSFFAKVKNWINDSIISRFTWLRALLIIIGMALVYGVYWTKKNLKISVKK
ncbi:hypothetical protein KAU19_06275 [Candidatus Parcubacteria bacterium]|nr:hypothetical protein [Candidatus Parcubacteria bacterium]